MSRYVVEVVGMIKYGPEAGPFYQTIWEGDNLLEAHQMLASLHSGAPYGATLTDRKTNEIIAEQVRTVK